MQHLVTKMTIRGLCSQHIEQKMNKGTTLLDLYLSIYMVLISRYHNIMVLFDGAKLYMFLKAPINLQI
jgi:hypothetical protein